MRNTATASGHEMTVANRPMSPPDAAKDLGSPHAVLP